MKLTMNFPGSDIAAYREQAERHKSCAGAMRHTFNCKVCGYDKKIAGRDQYVKGTTKFGYICAVCAEKRRAKRALKEAA